MKKLSIEEVQALQLTLMKKLHSYFLEKEINYYLIAGSALGCVRHNGFIPWDDDIDIGMLRKDYEYFLSVCQDFDSSYDIVNYKVAKNCDFALTRIYFRNTLIDNSSTRKTKLDKRLYLDIFPIDNIPNDERECAAFERKILRKKNILSRMDVRDYNNGKCALAAKKMIAFVLKPFRASVLCRFDKLLKKYYDKDTDRVCSLCSQYSFRKQAMPKSYYGTPTLRTFNGFEFYTPERIEDYLKTLYGVDYMEVPPENKRRKAQDIYQI